ncbi:MAG: hypothetical protein WEE53_11200 [Acidimicrobiia bacterium]
MPNDQGPESGSTGSDTIRVQTRARPWSGVLLGILLGLSIAVILQQAGVWPLDRLLVFGLSGIFGLIGILLTGWGRERGSALSSIVPLLLSVGMIAWGATGLTQLNETGELNGGCTVEAQSDVDTTIVTDTTRQNPFEVDPEGGLSWLATSPGPIMDHTWEIWVDVGGFEVVVADGGDPNTAGDLENDGDVTDVSAYVEEVTEVSGQQIRGVFEVGGDIQGTGGACDGFAFVRLTADPFETLASQIAAGLGLIALIALVTIAMRRTRMADVVAEDAAGASGDAADSELTQSDGVSATGAAEVVPESEGWMGAAKPDGDDSTADGSTRDDSKDDEGFPPTT